MKDIKLTKPDISDDCIAEVASTLRSGWLTQGSKVLKFENDIRKMLGVEHALAVNSATSGLHLALLALGVGQGDEVIVPAFTWVATANVVELCGAVPVFVDIDLCTFNTTVEQILSKITPKTKVIIPVHLFGKPFDVLALKNRIPKNIKIIEDAACALGASIAKNYCGAMGDVGVFSFHPRKSITTGEGGMVITNDPDLAIKINMLRNHGQDTDHKEDSPSFMFDCPVVGLNYRMTDIQAALGLGQLSRIKKMIAYRRELVNLYIKNLSVLDHIISLPDICKNEEHSWQSFIIRCQNIELRDAYMKQLKIFGIETRPGTHAVHLLSYYKNKYNINPLDYPKTYEAFKATIAIPLHNQMTIEDVSYVSHKIIEVTENVK